MGVRYFGEANDIIGNTWRIEIHDTTFASTPTEVTLGGGIFRHEFDGYEDLLFTPMQPSRCMIPFIVDDADTSFLSFIDNLPNALENQYFIIIKKGTALYFVGNLLVDQIQYDDNDTFIIELTATDGLKRLENYYYADINSTSDTYITDLVALSTALSYTGFEQFFGNSDVYIDSAISWFEIDQAKSSGTLLETRTQRELFYEDVEKLVPKKCSEVIEMILEKYGASIRFINGRWVIWQFENHKSGGVGDTFKYSKLNTLLAVGNNDIGDNRTITGNNSTRDRLLNTFLPALNRVDIKQNGDSEWMMVRPRGSSLVSFFNSSRTVTNLAGEVLIADFKWLLSHTVTSGYIRLVTRFVFEITDGTYYLKYDFATRQVSWTTNSADRYYYDLSGYYQSGNFIVTGQFYIPELPVGATGTTFEFNIEGVLSIEQPFGGGATISNNMDIGIGHTRLAQFMGAVGTGVGLNVEQTTTAAITNVLENSYVIEQDLAIFEQPTNVEFVKQWPQIWTGTTWVNSKEWSTNIVATSGIPLAEFLATEAIYHQRFPRRKIDGSFRLDEFYVYDTLVWRSKRWVFLRGEFNPKMCEWTGEWLEYGRQTSGSTATVDNPLRDEMEIVWQNEDDNRAKGGALDGAITGLNFEIEQLRTALSSLLLEHRFDTSTTMADPGSGDFRYNAAIHASTTAIALNKETSNGSQVNGLISALQVGDVLYIHQKDDSTKYGRYTVDGTPTDNTTWWQIPLLYVDGSASLPDNNKVCTITVSHV